MNSLAFLLLPRMYARDTNNTAIHTAAIRTTPAIMPPIIIGAIDNKFVYSRK